MKRIFILLLLSLFLLSSSCLPRPAFLGPNLTELQKTFVHVRINMVYLLCGGLGCSVHYPGILGSGVAVAHDSGDTIILTASHVCDGYATQPVDGSVLYRDMAVYSLAGKKYSGKIIKQHSEHDLCAVRVSGVSIPLMGIASEMPAPGEKVYNFAAPLGIFSPGMAPIFDGYYSGDVKSRGLSAYTVPSRSGSSGSAVLDSKGHLIGMIVLARKDLENFGLSPTLSQIQSFMKELRQELAGAS